MQWSLGLELVEEEAEVGTKGEERQNWWELGVTNKLNLKNPFF
jgi:hypothetical protein